MTIAEHWKRFGAALVKASDLLADFDAFEADGICVDSQSSRQLETLVGMGFIYEQDDTFHPTQTLTAIYHALQGRLTPAMVSDLNEAHATLLNKFESYHESRANQDDGRSDKLFLDVSQDISILIIGLKEELRGVEAYIEQEAGFGLSLTERIRQIAHVHGRLNRLASNLNVFDYNTLREYARADLALQGVIWNRLCMPISDLLQRIRSCLIKTEELSVRMRHQNVARERLFAVAQFLESYAPRAIEFFDSTNGPLVPIPIRIAELAANAHFQIMGEDQAQILQNLVSALPAPIDLETLSESEVLQEAEKRQALRVQRVQQEPINAPESWIDPHLSQMIKQLAQLREPVSAVQYWHAYGQNKFDTSLWLYALHGYFESLARKDQEVRSALRLKAVTKPRDLRMANIVITDLILERLEGLAAA